MPCAPGHPFTIDPAAATFQRLDIVARSFDMIACSNTCLRTQRQKTRPCAFERASWSERSWAQWVIGWT